MLSGMTQTTSQPLRWGILATGRIAGDFARGVRSSKHGVLAAVGSRSQDSADAFAAEHEIPHAHASYEALLADDTVDAVYVATPHPWHPRWAIRTAEAGKHVLTEKPAGINHAQTMAMIEAAIANDVFFMEAFMYRCHPQIERLTSLVREGAIGDVKLVQATFGFGSGGPRNPDHRIYSNAMGGGGILDVGCYATSMARLIAGAATGEPGSIDPTEVSGAGLVGPTEVDEYTAATLRFPNDVIAQVVTSIWHPCDNVVRIFGTRGSILVPTPWVPKGNTEIHVTTGGETQVVTVECDQDLYALEADAVAEHLADRQTPQVSWADSLGNMRTLDLWREAIGLEYVVERFDGPEQNEPLRGEPLEFRTDTDMKYGSIAGVDKRISRLVMGVDNQTRWPHASVMFDDFVQRGGTTFDTGFIYGRGKCEEMLGEWMEARGIRDDIVILDKCAHTPHNFPNAIAPQLEISLGRLRSSYIDLYVLHRDNPDVPVSEWIDALNVELKAGRINAIGASNWALDRVAEANAYAEANGLTGFAIVSNNFSLARMVEPVWAGCIAASDPESRAWLTERQMPLMPWSSQARGFFVPGRSAPDKTDDAELVRSWYADDNFARKERADKLAAEKGVEPIVIALAYVLSQPFPTFPLIGPRAISETRSSFAALSVELTPDEVRWLNLED